MAEDKVAIEVEVKGSEESIQSMKDLKAAIKAAKDEQIKAAQVYGESSAEYIKATKNVSALKDKVEDLNDSTKSLKGSGVERASEGFNQLGEGLRNLDFDKVKAGLVAMKSALAAVGIGLIVQAVMYLVENFEELSKGSGLLAKALQFVGDIIGGLKDAFLKFGDILQGINPELRGMSEEIDNLKESMNGLLSEQMGRLDRLIAVTKANGESTIAYENLKQEAIIKTNKLYVDSIISYVKAGGQLNEEQKKQLTASLENIANAKTQQQVLEITETKKLKEEQDKRLVDKQKYLDDLAKQELDAWNKTVEIRIANAEAQRLEEERLRQEKLAADKAAMDESLAYMQEVGNQEQFVAVSNADFKAELRKQELEDFKTNYNAQLNTAQSLTNSLQQLSDAYFYFKTKNLKKGSEEERKQAKKQFDINKGISIATATISGIQGVVNALSAQSVIPEPFGAILKGVTAVAVGAAAAANIAKIASTKFDDGGGSSGGGGASAVASVAVPAPPTINIPSANTNQSTSFDETGKKIGGEKEVKPTIKVESTVSVTEINDKQDRVKALETQSTF